MHPTNPAATPLTPPSAQAKPFSHGQSREQKISPEHSAKLRRDRVKKRVKQQKRRRRIAEAKRASRATTTQEDMDGESS